MDEKNNIDFLFSIKQKAYHDLRNINPICVFNGIVRDLAEIKNRIFIEHDKIGTMALYILSNGFTVEECKYFIDDL